jgi:hypothetical protein
MSRPGSIPAIGIGNIKWLAVLAFPLFFGKKGDCARFCAQTRFEVCALPFRCQLEVLFVDDVVALEEAAGLVARNRHGHSLRHAGAHHVAYRCSTQVMEDPVPET